MIKSDKTFSNARCKNLWAFGFASFLCIWCICALLFLANPIANQRTFSFKTNNGIAISDFVHFYLVGRMVISDERMLIYDPETQLDVTNQLISPNHINSVFYCQYVPFLFPGMAPLAMLTMPAAYILWYVTSLVLGAGTLFFICKYVRKFSRRDTVIIIAAAISSVPSIICLKIGQTSWFLLCFFSLIFYAIKYKHRLLGGISLALSTIKPQYTLLLLTALFSARRWGILIVFSIVEIVLLVLSGMVVGWKNVINYPFILLKAETFSNYAGVNSEGMISLRGIFSQFLSREYALGISIVCMLVALFSVFWLWRLISKQKITEEWAMALTIIMCLIVSPHSHVYDLLLLILPAVLTLSNLSLIEISKLPLSMRIWCFVLISYPVTSWIFYYFQIPWMFLLLNFVLLFSGYVSSKLKIYSVQI